MDGANNAPAGGHTRCANRFSGEVAEWSNAPDSKSGLRLCRNVGSNPTLSARNENAPFAGRFSFPMDGGGEQNHQFDGFVWNESGQPKAGPVARSAEG